MLLIFYIVTGLISYLVGICSYMLMLKIVWNESLGGDAPFVLIWGAIAFFIIAFPIYLLIILLINKKATRHKYIYYPLGCMLVFFIPTFFIAFRWGSTDLLSPEAILFHSFFLSAGLVFGLCAYGINTWKMRGKE